MKLFSCYSEKLNLTAKRTAKSTTKECSPLSHLLLFVTFCANFFQTEAKSPRLICRILNKSLGNSTHREISDAEMNPDIYDKSVANG
jgi:hypothetical protein